MTQQTSSSSAAAPRSPTRHRLRRYGPLLLWLVLIFFASSNEFSAENTSWIIRPLLLWLFPHATEAQLATAHFLTRKAGHFSEYAVLAFLAHRAFFSSAIEFVRDRWFQIGLLLIVVYALLDEFHQSFVPSRTPSIYDSLIDIAGGATVLLLFKLAGRRSARREAAD
jgi:VanZ family protein